MCGRFTLRTSAEQIARAMDVAVPELAARYNIAPTQPVGAVRLGDGGQRQWVMLRWGLVPSWADDPKIGNRMINARAETVASKPAFRSAFAKRRCLIVADGFYEWQATDGAKQPYFFHLQDHRPFGLGGLWEHWRRDGQTVQSCTIVVTQANAAMTPIHDRMPVIIPPEQYDLWLDPEFRDREKLEELLQPYRGDDLQIYPVSTVVNKPQNDVATCVEPLARSD